MEKKVIDALSKDFLEYINILDIQLIGEQGVVIKEISQTDNVANGEIYTFSAILSNEE